MLLTALVLQLQMLQQLIPVVRFDGYYVLSDLAGVPDLFARVGPVLRCLRPGQPPDPRVTELRPQRAPVRDRLGAGRRAAARHSALRWLLWHLPASSSARTLEARLQQLASTWPGSAATVAAMALAVVSMLLLLVPLAGMTSCCCAVSL